MSRVYLVFVRNANVCRCALCEDSTLRGGKTEFKCGHLGWMLLPTLNAEEVAGIYR